MIRVCTHSTKGRPESNKRNGVFPGVDGPLKYKLAGKLYEVISKSCSTGDQKAFTETLVRLDAACMVIAN